MLGAIYWRWSGGVNSQDMEDLTDLGRAMGYIYSLSYEFLVLNLLFGILFGLVFEAYGRTKADAGKTDSLVTQVFKSMAEMSVGARQTCVCLPHVHSFSIIFYASLSLFEPL